MSGTVAVSEEQAIKYIAKQLGISEKQVRANLKKAGVRK